MPVAGNFILHTKHPSIRMLRLFALVEDVQQLFAAQLLAAAAGQHRGIRHGLEVGIRRDAQFGKGGGQADLLDEGRQSLHASLCRTP